MSTTTLNFDFLKKEDTEYSDHTMALIESWYQHYADLFVKSKVAELSLSEEAREEFPFILSSFCDFCYSHHLEKPGQWTSATIQDVCLNIMPRKVMAEPIFFELISPILCNFLAWMSSEHYLQNTAKLQDALLALDQKIRTQSENPNNWGMGKSLVMGAKKKGYDTENFNAIKAALYNENADDLLTEIQAQRKPPKQPDEIRSIEDIIDELQYVTDGYPTAAVEQALQKKEEVTPILLDILSDAVEFYQEVEDEYVGHLYALFILAYFREKRAFPLIMQLTALPNDWTDRLLGDAITNDLPAIIASVFDGDLHAMKALIEDPNVFTWSQNALLEALLVLVKQTILDRKDVLAYFKTLFQHPAFTHSKLSTTLLIMAAEKLFPDSLYDEIKLAFAKGRVNLGLIDMDQIESALALGEKACLEKYIDNSKSYDFIGNPIAIMQRWAFFNKRENAYQQPAVNGLDYPMTNDRCYERKTPKIGRNEPCPCGSGKKFKKCCLQ